ncbi:DUF1709-domain-containing protein [Rhizodiscina lignyota]|uniref:DUF1709-domain-containing protein n=1 Tax=Rhizodiscina lignyota TaxID=1504668 RepID=A0A9P4IJM7_9PEZI|nr:DUF1709-domain-containing protein [Rhizodiscina lignyota]
MPSEAVQPLRINKNNPSSSPTKMSSSNHRPLSEISPMERRRNSPSYNQATKREPSPFDSSPWNTSTNSAGSPRAFWQGRDPTSPSRFIPSSENAYDPEITASPQRRSSIEKLKKASRVKNSSMFAREQKNEYDPASPQLQLERPLATGRPLTVQVQGNAFNGEGLEGMRKNNPEFRGHRRGQSQSKIPLLNSSSPAKSEQSSPSRGSISSTGRTSNASKFDADNSTFSEGDSEVRTSTPRPLRRQAKSVTFDNGPPQVNEYEMVTPDPSSVASGSREGSYEDSDYDSEEYNEHHGGREDSFDESLEDTAKTPVVLPEDWRYMSPENANNGLVQTFEDPFDGPNGSPSPSAKASVVRLTSFRSESATSDTDRPLPPIPGMQQSRAPRLSATAERASSNPRSLPSPPGPATVSKAEILNMKDRSSLSLEDRFRLMGMQDSNAESPPNEVRAARAARLQKAHVRDHGMGIQVHEDETAEPEKGEIEVPHISRESILRKMRADDDDDDEKDNLYDGSGYGDFDLATLDPDVPIPSREASSNFDENPHENAQTEMRIKQEDEESEVDVYSIPDLYSPERSPSRMDLHDREGSVIRRGSDGSDHVKKGVNSNSTTEDEGPPTPKADEFNISKARSPLLERAKENGGDSGRSSLPEFDSLLDDGDFKMGLQSYMSQEDTAPSERPAPPNPIDAMPKLEAVHDFLQRPSTPLSDLKNSTSSASDEEIAEEPAPGSPGSVIHNPSTIEPEEHESPFIPEQSSTIKAPGSQLKARPSLTHADAGAMAAQRRRVSGEDMPQVPPVPAKSPRRRSSIGIAQAESQVDAEDEEEPFRKSSLEKITIDGISFGREELGGLSLELTQEFDRVIEAQKKGYLMRQNTKVVVARARDFSDEKVPASPEMKHEAPVRGTRSAGPSPRKSSAGNKFLTTEPWNGKVRRKSIRTASGSRKTVPATGPVPPLPGQESSVSGPLAEETASRDSYEEADYDEGAERGRLFVKVIGVKDLDLPLPKTERTNFQLTLDNGLHCVTTSWLELNRAAPIGQEFELVVLNDLEFQLTLQTKLTPPPQPAKPKSGPSASASSPTKKTHTAKKSSFSQLLMSPKKRKEAEARRQAEERERAAQEQKEREAAAKRASAASSMAPKTAQTAWDMLHDLVAPDGSFARSYISLKSFEESCYGRPLSVDVPAYNEWAAESDPMVIESMRSKRGHRGGEAVRRPPYQVGKLQLQLLYVPKPKGATDDDMPRSLNGAVREMERVREAAGKKWEGCLSQQGGDCPYWRRRFFRLQGTKLTAYHESTHQPRATINLAKAVKLIDDRSSLLQPDTSSPTKTGKSRRKSAFAEEEEGYMFVEEGFRIRFANGETIDFYADNNDQKAGWMKALADVVGKSDTSSSKGWTDMVLRKEAKTMMGSRKPVPKAKGETVEERPSSAPKMEDTMHRKTGLLDVEEEDEGDRPMPIDKSPRHAAHMRSAMGQAQRRQKTRSMIF